MRARYIERSKSEERLLEKVEIEFKYHDIADVEFFELGDHYVAILYVEGPSGDRT